MDHIPGRYKSMRPTELVAQLSRIDAEQMVHRRDNSGRGQRIASGKGADLIAGTVESAPVYPPPISIRL